MCNGLVHPIHRFCPRSFLIIMATRSRIGIELSDGSVLSSYHHWDGYPQWLGRILTTHYNSKVKHLI